MSFKESYLLITDFPNVETVVFSPNYFLLSPGDGSTSHSIGGRLGWRVGFGPHNVNIVTSAPSGQQLAEMLHGSAVFYPLTQDEQFPKQTTPLVQLRNKLGCGAEHLDYHETQK